MAGRTKTDEQVPAPSAAQPGNGAPTQEQVERKNFFAASTKHAKVSVDLSKLKVGKTLSKQLFSIAHSKSLVIKCNSELYDQILPVAGRGKEQENTAKLVDVLNLETGEEGALICTSLIVKGFEEAKGTITGRMFAIQEGGIKEGKKYRSIEMVELSE